eukprot:6197597-Pleurochrysis_carterae.AAC.1
MPERSGGKQREAPFGEGSGCEAEEEREQQGVEPRFACASLGRTESCPPHLGVRVRSQASERVLRVVASDLPGSATAGSGTGAHLTRFVLRTCRAQAVAAAETAAVALRTGVGASDELLAAAWSASRSGRLLIALISRAEAITGKEAPTG